MRREQAAARLEQPAEEGGRDVERRVRHHVERPSRQTQVACVGLHDDDPTDVLAEMTGPVRMGLDGDDVRPGVEERSRQRTVAGTDVEDEVAGTDRCLSDEPSCVRRVELVPSPVPR